MNFEFARAKITAACIVVLFVIWCVACLPWLSGRYVIGWDNLDYVYPQVRFLAQSILRGEFPAWNPYSFGGMTVIGDPQGMLFSPHTLAATILGERYSIRFNDLTTLACVFGGSVAFFLYVLRENNNKYLWALIAAIVFMLGGSATARLQHVPQIVSYAMLPIILLLIQHICLNRATWAVCALVAVLAVFLVNLNQVALIAVFVLSPLAINHILRSDSPMASMFGLAIPGLAAVVIVMPVVVAMFETINLSSRALAVASADFSMSLPPYTVLGLGVDGLFGMNNWPVSPLWTPTDPSQDYLYIGIIPLVCVALAFITGKAKDTRLLICLALFVLVLLFSMGSYTPFFPFFFHHVPGFSFTRRPADSEYFIVLFAAMLVAYTGPMLETLRLSRSRAIWGGAFIALCAFGVVIAWRQISALAATHGQSVALADAALRTAVKIVVALLIVEAFFVAKRKAARAVAASVVLIFVTVDLLSSGRFSYFVAVPAGALEISPLYQNSLRWRENTEPFADIFRFLERNGSTGPSAQYRVEVLGGPLAVGVPLTFETLNSQGYSPMRIYPYAAVFGQQVNTLVGRQFPAGTWYNDKANRDLGLKWVLVYKPSVTAEPSLPESWKSVGQIRAELAWAPWSHLRKVFGNYELWEIDGAEPRLRTAGLAPGEASSGECDVSFHEASSIGMTCTSDSTMRVTFNDAMAPGWFACVNGSAAPIELDDGVFKSVVVPAGKSNVTMRYQGLPWLRWLNKCSDSLR